VLLLRRRYDHRGHARIGDHRIIVARMQVRAGGVGQRPGAGGIAVGDGEEAHRRMLGREPRPQRADPPGADHRDAEIAALHGVSSPARAGGPSATATLSRVPDFFFPLP
jgi:hypothetical protein